MDECKPLTNGDGAYLVLMLGGARCATDCLKVETIPPTYPLHPPVYPLYTTYVHPIFLLYTPYIPQYTPCNPPYTPMYPKTRRRVMSYTTLHSSGRRVVHRVVYWQSPCIALHDTP